MPRKIETGEKRVEKGYSGAGSWRGGERRKKKQRRKRGRRPREAEFENFGENNLKGTSGKEKE